MLVNRLKPSSVLGFAFNKAIVEENKRLYPDYVEWKTLHALALSKVRPKLPIEDFTYTCIKEPLSYAEKRIVINMMDDYYRSADIDMYEFMENYLAVRDIHNDKLIHITAKYIEGMLNNTVNPNFNYLLKALHAYMAENEITVNYDMVLLDEVQDSTAVALEIFKLIDANMKVGLGDEHQSLYAFMNLVNGFEVLTGAETAELTQSFRCSTAIAERVEKFGKQWLSHDFHFKGNPDPEADGRMMYVTATNAQIVERLAELQRQGINAYTLTRPITEIFAAPLALTTASTGKQVLHKKYKFLENEYKLFRKSSYNKFFTFLQEEVDDEEIRNAIKLLMNFQKKRINVFDVMAQAKKARKDRNLIIGTVHSLKGLGVETVHIGDDLNRMVLEIIAKGGPENHDDKVTMMMGYVASTRAKCTLLNAKFL